MTKLQFFQLKKNVISIWNVNTSVYTSSISIVWRKQSQIPSQKVHCQMYCYFYGAIFHFVDINKSFMEGKLDRVWIEEESQRGTALIREHHKNINEKCYNKEDGETYLISINLRQGFNRDQTCSFRLLIICRYPLQTENNLEYIYSRQISMSWCYLSHKLRNCTFSPGRGNSCIVS